MISAEMIETAGYEIMKRAAIDIPEDYLAGIKATQKQEQNTLSGYVIKTMIDNYDAATEDRRPMCADTGLPRYYVKIGDKAPIGTGFTSIERALRSATARATTDVPLRPNRVHPLWRTEHNNNVGINAPEIEWSFEPDVDWIERGLCCQPAIVGIGLGGSKDTCMQLGKQAACLRSVGEANPDPEIAKLEAELMELGNNIGMGPMGFVGSSMVVDCHIEVGYTHTGGMPVSVHTFCLSSRRATARIHADGTIEYRSDPRWFTPYMRRETVEW